MFKPSTRPLLVALLVVLVLVIIVARSRKYRKPALIALGGVAVGGALAVWDAQARPRRGALVQGGKGRGGQGKGRRRRPPQNVKFASRVRTNEGSVRRLKD